MTSEYQDDDRMLTRIMAEAAPTKVSAKAFEVTGPNADGMFIASVIQISATGAGQVERDLLETARFGTQRNADRWLNKRR